MYCCQNRHTFPTFILKPNRPSGIGFYKLLYLCFSSKKGYCGPKNNVYVEMGFLLHRIYRFFFSNDDHSYKGFNKQKYSGTLIELP